MTQHGCATKGFTSSAVRSWGLLTSSVVREPVVSVTAATSATDTSTPTLAPAPASSKLDLGVIVGGTIGGCTVLSLVVLAMFLVHRRRKTATQIAPVTQYHSAVTENSPHGFPVEVDAGDEQKAWGRGEVSRAGEEAPRYPGMGSAKYGVVEVDGVQRPVEAPADNEYRAREFMRD
jgi:hypothetical protein